MKKAREMARELSWYNNGMLIEYSRHAERRMRERGISKMLIEQILTNPTRVAHIENDKFMYYHETGNEKLVVIIIKKRDRFTIVTAYYED